MMVWVPGKFSEGLVTSRWQQSLGNKACHQALTINEQALGRIVAGFEGGFVFISDGAKPYCGFVHDAFRGSFKTVCSHCPCGISASRESVRRRG
jgi:hypothetical protein